MSTPPNLFTIGYGRWPAKQRWEKLVAALRHANVDVLVDIRHSPCSANLDPQLRYGPRRWNLQAGSEGIVDGLRVAGIEYRWLVELGNPQPKDRRMAVLREHIAETRASWPVHRGLELLKALVLSHPKHYCLLCACKDYDACHRKVIAEEFVRFCQPREVRLVATLG